MKYLSPLLETCVGVSASYGPILTTFFLMKYYFAPLSASKNYYSLLLYSNQDLHWVITFSRIFLYYFLVFSPSYSLLVLNNKSNSISPLILGTSLNWFYFPWLKKEMKYLSWLLETCVGVSAMDPFWELLFF
jgi:hypothetical protein